MPNHSNDLSTEQWRIHMDEQLRAENGWLSLAGLFWLDEGPNRVGSDPDAAVPLPKNKAPANVASLLRNGKQVTLIPEPGSGLLLNGEPATEQKLEDDHAGAADMLQIGDLSFFIIVRGERVGVRLRDRAHPKRASFSGRQWYPIRDEMRITGRFLAHDPPRPIMIANVLGDIEEYVNGGAIVFTVADQECRLETFTVNNGKLFIILRDQTSGKTTYGMGRFLDAELADDQQILLDFNRAYNPPCAFTEFATCPMPPRENYLPVAIEAGERLPKEGH